jgi:hypothetical protein
MANDARPKLVPQLLHLGARCFFYILAVAATTQLIVYETVPGHVDDLYNEWSLTEWYEMFFIVLALCVVLRVGALVRTRKPLAMVFSGVLLMALIREADMFLDVYVFDGSWQLLATVTACATIGLIWHRRYALGSAVQDFVSQPAFGIMLSGFLIVFVFARLFGRHQFWLDLMWGQYLRSVKNVAEEGPELVGYLLILISTVEWWSTCERT